MPDELKIALESSDVTVLGKTLETNLSLVHTLDGRRWTPLHIVADQITFPDIKLARTRLLLTAGADGNVLAPYTYGLAAGTDRVIQEVAKTGITSTDPATEKPLLTSWQLATVYGSTEVAMEILGSTNPSDLTEKTNQIASLVSIRQSVMAILGIESRMEQGARLRALNDQWSSSPGRKPSIGGHGAGMKYGYERDD